MNKPNKELKERPILFSAPMVRAILDGRKTKTRRVVKIQPPADGFELSRLIESTSKADAKNEGRLHWIKRDGLRIIANDKRFFSCPYGQPCCDRLWVRETFAEYLLFGGRENIDPSYDLFVVIHRLSPDKTYGFGQIVMSDRSRFP